MTIATIKFSDTGKTYDYLLENKERNTVNTQKPLKMIVGCSRASTIVTTMTLVSLRKVDTYPSHIISLLHLDSNNYVTTRRLTTNEIRKLQNLRSTPPRTSIISCQVGKEYTWKEECERLKHRPFF